MNKPDYLKWIVKEEGIIKNYDKILRCYKIKYNCDPDILDDWALHIRRHYISDEELIEDCALLNIDTEEYLRSNLIPQKNDKLGPTARSSTISEILFSDLIEFVLGYHVPRYRQYNMSGKTVSEHGTDVIGYRFINQDKTPSTEDILIATEVKAILSSNDTNVIKKAYLDSKKDEFRVSIALNYMRKKLKNMGKIDESNDILRFQKKTKKGYDYHIDYIAAGITGLDSLEEVEIEGKIVNIIPGIDGAELTISDDRSIFFVHGKDLMKLTHEVYERCIK